MAINFPEGTQNLPSNVLQAKVAQTTGSNGYAIITGATNAQYSLGYSNRVYVDLCSVSITPISSSSTIIIQGVAGGDNSNVNYHTSGAFGLVCILNNAHSGNVDNTDYQWYPMTNSFSTGAYLPNSVCQGSYAAGNTSAQTWYLKGYSYSENNATNKVQFRDSHLLLLEVEI